MAQHHHRQAALPGRPLRPLEKAGHRIAIISPPVRMLSRLQEEITPLCDPQQILKLPPQAQMQVLLPGIHSRDKYLHLLLYLPGGRPGQEQPIQKEGAVPVCGFPPKQLLGHILQILAGEKSVIIFLEPGCSLPAKGRVLLPLDAQTAEQQVQNLRAALYLPLLNFRQIGHSAYPITQRRLRPFPLLPPLPNEQPLQLLPQ